MHAHLGRTRLHNAYKLIISFDVDDCRDIRSGHSLIYTLMNHISGALSASRSLISNCCCCCYRRDYRSRTRRSAKITNTLLRDPREFVSRNSLTPRHVSHFLDRVVFLSSAVRPFFERITRTWREKSGKKKGTKERKIGEKTSKYSILLTTCRANIYFFRLANSTRGHKIVDTTKCSERIR